MGKIKKILENELVGGTQSTDVYPVTSVKAVYDENNERLDHILNRRGTVNISTNYNSDHTAEVLTLSQAIAKVPASDRTLGFVGTFLTADGWNTYQFNGDSLTEWSDTSKWVSAQNNSISNANQAMQGIGRYCYWTNSKPPTITIENGNRVLTWESLVILDTVSRHVHIKYHNNKLEMILPLSGILVIYGEVVKGETHFSLFYDVAGGTVSPENHTSFYKKTDNAKDIVVIGVVETVRGTAKFFDFLKIASYNWGGVPSLTDDVNTLTDDVNTFKGNIEDTIKYSEALSHLVTINEDDHIYGRYSPESPLSNIFPIAAHVDCSATTTNSEAESDGFLTEVRAQVNGAGNYTFRVGLLDQYSRFVVSNEFILHLSNGLNIIDVSDKRILIAKGEQLAISCTSNAGTSGTSSLRYGQNTKHIDNELLYGFNNGTWAKLASEYGGEINLSYKMLSVNSIFALKSNIDSLEEQIEKQNDTINSLRYVYDNNGVPYKLSIYNGEIVVESVQYKKVLALGNSLTSHGYAKNIGYYGDNTWAMASTNKITTTWTNHLQTILRQKQSDATVTPFNIAEWETNYMGVDLDTLFASHKGIKYDLIVIRAGENGTAGDDYAQGVDRLVTFLRTNFPAANIIITEMFWHNSTKEAGFMEIAKKYNYPYISFGNIADRCLLGQMLMGRDGQFHPITHNGVAGHCTDVCFFDFANILANALGYSQISGKYTVTINTSIDYSINQTSQVADGYVSILTYGSSAPTVNVKQGGSVVQTTTHSLSGVSWINTPSKVPTFVTTFKMPSGDVIVSI